MTRPLATGWAGLWLVYLLLVVLSPHCESIVGTLSDGHSKEIINTVQNNDHAHSHAETVPAQTGEDPKCHKITDEKDYLLVSANAFSSLHKVKKSGFFVPFHNIIILYAKEKSFNPVLKYIYYASDETPLYLTTLQLRV